MINIISKCYCRRFTTGPKKVVDNLIKGLDRIGYPYVVNRRLDACKRLWIHDDVDALMRLKDLPQDIKVVVGPNLVVQPRCLPKGVNLSRAVYVHPSEWAVALWQKFNPDRSYPVVPWAAGIDTEDYRPQDGAKTEVLIYFKQRYPEELARVEDILRRKGIRYSMVTYGSYVEGEFKKILAKARYGIWLGRHETQGIALQETLAAGVPLVVWDVQTLGHWAPGRREQNLFTAEELAYGPATAAEYFDDSCGIRIYEAGELEGAISRMEQDFRSFMPRQYVLDHLSLQKQARDFVNLYERHFGLSFEAGITERQLGEGDWVNNSWPLRAKWLAKDLAKYILSRVRRP